MRCLWAVFLLFALMGCENKKKQDKPALSAEAVSLLSGILYEEEILDAGQLLLTFSMSSKNAADFELFKLGIIDVIVEVNISGETVRHSLEGKLIPEDFYIDDAKSVDLTHLGDRYHYYGIFDVPAGQLAAVEVAFSGSKTDIIKEGRILTLVDPFFALYPRVGMKNKDGLVHQRFPERVRQESLGGITFSKGDLTVLALDINQAETVTHELVESSEQDIHYAFFSPVYTVNELPREGDFVKPFLLRFNEAGSITFQDKEQPLMVVGDLATMLFVAEFDLKNNASVFQGGEKMDALPREALFSDYDVSGTLALNTRGYFYHLDSVNITFFEREVATKKREGTVFAVTDTGVSLHGKSLALNKSDASLLDETFFSDVIRGEFDGVQVGDRVEVLTMGPEVRWRTISPSPKGKSRASIDINTSVAITDVDLLGLLDVKSSDEKSIYVDKVSCDEIISHCQKGEKLSRIDFSSVSGTSVTAIAKRGQFIKEADNNTFIRLPTLIKTYEDNINFLDVLREQVKEGYLLYRISAQGDYTAGVFTLKQGVRAIFFQPALDESEIPLLEGLQDNTLKEGFILKGLFSISTEKRERITGFIKSGLKKFSFADSYEGGVNQTKMSSVGGVKKSSVFSRQPALRQRSDIGEALMGVNKVLLLNTAMTGGSIEMPVVSGSLQPGEASKIESTILLDAPSDDFNGIDDITSRVKQHTDALVEKAIPNKSDVVVPEVGEKRPTLTRVDTPPSRIKQLSEVLMKAGILSGMEPIHLATVNERIRAMSDVDFNATLNFRSNYDQLAGLLATTNLFDSTDAAKNRIANALSQAAVQDLHTGDVEKTKRVLVEEADSALKRKKTQLGTFDGSQAAGNAVPKAPPPPLVKELVLGEAGKLQGAESVVKKISVQPTNLLDEIRANSGKNLKKVDRDTIKPVDSRNTLLADIRSAAKLRSKSSAFVDVKETAQKAVYSDEQRKIMARRQFIADEGGDDLDDWESDDEEKQKNVAGVDDEGVAVKNFSVDDLALPADSSRAKTRVSPDSVDSQRVITAPNNGGISTVKRSLKR